MYLKGIVSDRDPKKGMVRVSFPDHDDMVSYWLPVVQKKTLIDKHYEMPDVNEHVACIMEENIEEGVVLGAIYSDEDTVPAESNEIDHVTYADGTSIQYDRETSIHNANYADGTTILYDANGSKLSADFTDGGKIEYDAGDSEFNVELPDETKLEMKESEVTIELPDESKFEMDETKIALSFTDLISLKYDKILMKWTLTGGIIDIIGVLGINITCPLDINLTSAVGNINITPVTGDANIINCNCT